MKIQNIIFSVLLCAFLCGPGALWVAQEKLHLSIPSWFTAEDAQYLSGGILRADVEQNLTIEGFEFEKLQKALENKIGNYIPLKAAAILENGELQRNACSIMRCVWLGVLPYVFWKRASLHSCSKRAHRHCGQEQAIFW